MLHGDSVVFAHDSSAMHLGFLKARWWMGAIENGANFFQVFDTHQQRLLSKIS